MLGAARDADARVQQAQVVVDLGDGADGGARVVRGRLLLDRDRRRQAFDVVDVGLLHHRQELPRVRGQRFDVAALAFGVQRVERERRLARARQSRDHDQLVARQVEVDVLEVVRAGAADLDLVCRHRWLVLAAMERKGRPGAVAAIEVARTAGRENGRPNGDYTTALNFGAKDHFFKGQRAQTGDVRYLVLPAGHSPPQRAPD